MAFTDLAADGIPDARLKQGMGLIEQAEQAGISVRMSDGNRLRTLEQKERAVVTAFNGTIPNTGELQPYQSGFTYHCWWRIPPDITEGRIYIDHTGSNSEAFTVRVFPEYTEGSSSKAFDFDTVSTITTDATAGYSTFRIQGLTGVEAMGLYFENDKGADRTYVIRFVCETAYGGIA